MENLKFFLEILESIAVIVTAGAAVAGVIIAKCQLSGLKKSIDQANLMGMLDIEFELNRRKERLADIRRKTSETLNTDNGKVLYGNVQEAFEDYLNIFDRLAYFILKGKFDEDDFCTEYREMLADTINANESKFGAGTRYRNMQKLNERWQSK